MTNPLNEQPSAVPAPQTQETTVSGILITREIAQRILAIIDHGLSYGMGEQEPGKMCVEAAVCYGLNLPHGDDPGCVAISLRALKISLNDTNWSSEKARAKGLRRLGLAQLGSRDALDECHFAELLTRLITTKYVPLSLRAAASIHEEPAYRAELESAATTCEREGSLASCDQAKNAVGDPETADRAPRIARMAADTAANAHFWTNQAVSKDPANNDGRSGIYAAAEAAVAAAEVGIKAALVAGIVAAKSAVYPADAEEQTVDTKLTEFAEDIVQILIQLQAPGCQWLDLTEAA